MNTEPEKYTLEEIKQWAAENPGAHIDCIVAWKERKEKRDEDAQWVRSRFFSDGVTRERFHAIADRLEALQNDKDHYKALSEVNYIACDDWAKRALAAEKRVAELEANTQDWQIREDMARKQAEKQPDDKPRICDKGHGWLNADGTCSSCVRNTPQPGADGWIPHKAGDPMPCDGETKIDFKLRNHEGDSGTRAKWLMWIELGDSTVTHWRPAK